MPTTLQQTTSAAPCATEKEARNSAWILVVDDQSSNLKLLTIMLEAQGYRTMTASNGEEALQCLEQRLPDLVLTDVMMPGIDGFDLCRRVKKHSEFQHIPVVMVTAAGEPENKITALKAGADDLLIKPFNQMELQARIAAMLKAKQLQDQLREHEAELEQLNRELVVYRRRTERQLELAREIHFGLLPRQLPELDQLTCAALYEPCEMLGGDFYNVFPLDLDHLGIYVADVMGHGVAASLLTVFVKMGLESKVYVDAGRQVAPANEVLQHLNNDFRRYHICDDTFATLWYGILNVRTFELQHASAGHPKPFLVSADGSVRTVDSQGPLLGVFTEPYSVAVDQLQVGDRLVCFTDGFDQAIWEENLVGNDALSGYLQATRDEDLSSTTENMFDRLFAHLRSSPDDVTLLAMDIREATAG